jgi:large subunit ribosomal protein L15
MKLNTLSPAPGSKTEKKRLGRGIGSGHGKTCGKGHKGQKARSGGYHKRGIGFEGGQTPLHRRLPKFGFLGARDNMYHQTFRLDVLNSILSSDLDFSIFEAFSDSGEAVTQPVIQAVLSWFKSINLIRENTKSIKFYLAGELLSAKDLDLTNAKKKFLKQILSIGDVVRWTKSSRELVEKFL